MERNKREYDCCGDDEDDGDEVQIISQTRSFDKFNFSAAQTSSTRIANAVSPSVEGNIGDTNDWSRNSSGPVSGSVNYAGELTLSLHCNVLHCTAQDSPHQSILHTSTPTLLSHEVFKSLCHSLLIIFFSFAPHHRTVPIGEMTPPPSHLFSLFSLLYLCLSGSEVEDLELSSALRE